MQHGVVVHAKRRGFSDQALRHLVDGQEQPAQDLLDGIILAIYAVQVEPPNWELSCTWKMCPEEARV